MKGSSWWRGRAKKRAEDAREQVQEVIPDPENFEVRIGVLSHAHAVLDPSTTIGPEPLHVPLTGYNVYVDVEASGGLDVVLLGLRAGVLGRRPMQPSGLSLVPQAGPGLSYDRELEEVYRRARARYQPMLVPDVEVFLDETPPLVRPALDGQGMPVVPDFRLPMRIAAARPGGSSWPRTRRTADSSSGIWSPTSPAATTGPG